MLTFNRVVWPLVVLLLIVPEFTVVRAGFVTSVIPIALIQAGICYFFIYRDWQKKLRLQHHCEPVAVICDRVFGVVLVAPSTGGIRELLDEALNDIQSFQPRKNESPAGSR